MISIDSVSSLQESLHHQGVRLIAVSKTKTAEEILQVYHSGIRDFGENKVQEMREKYEKLPRDIRWHMIGHLQSNKVKYIAPFVHLIHSVDSLKLLTEINRQAAKHQRVIDYLLQLYIAKEETKFGLSEEEIVALLNSAEWKVLNNVRLRGLMAMATNTDDTHQIEREFSVAQQFFHKLKKQFDQESAQVKFTELSMGMSSDYTIALKYGTTLVRIGSLIFGARDYLK